MNVLRSPHPREQQIRIRYTWKVDLSLPTRNFGEIADLVAHKSRIGFNVISQTAEYALRAVVYLGSQVGQPVTTQRVAAATRVPMGYLSKVLQALGRAGLVEAQRGLRGGYVLARPLDELTILDVVKSVDPLQRITGCPLGLESHDGSLCALHRRLDAGISMVESLFQSTTIDQLLHEHSSRRNPLCEVAPLGTAASSNGDTTTGDLG